MMETPVHRAYSQRRKNRCKVASVLGVGVRHKPGPLSWTKIYTWPKSGRGCGEGSWEVGWRRPSPCLMLMRWVAGEKPHVSAPEWLLLYLHPSRLLWESFFVAHYDWKHTGKEVLGDVILPSKLTDFKATTDGNLNWTRALGVVQGGSGLKDGQKLARSEESSHKFWNHIKNRCCLNKVCICKRKWKQKRGKMFSQRITCLKPTM